MQNSFYYAFKVWIYGVLISPLIVITVISFIYGLDDPSSVPFIYIAMVLIGGLASIPSFITLWLITSLINKTSVSVLQQRVILSFSGSFLTIITFLIVITLDEKLDWSDFNIISVCAIGYSITTVLAINFVQLPQLIARISSATIPPDFK